MTESLVITDLTPGTGKTAEKGALIHAHYRGWLTDGTEFDSSHKRGEAFQCVIGTRRVIAGWDQGILGDNPMREGGVRRLQVPAHLGYGARGAGALIPPNADLVFEIELIKVLTRDD